MKKKIATEIRHSHSKPLQTTPLSRLFEELYIDCPHPDLTLIGLNHCLGFG